MTSPIMDKTVESGVRPVGYIGIDGVAHLNHRKSTTATIYAQPTGTATEPLYLFPASEDAIHNAAVRECVAYCQKFYLTSGDEIAHELRTLLRQE